MIRKLLKRFFPEKPKENFSAKSFQNISFENWETPSTGLEDLKNHPILKGFLQTAKVNVLQNGFLLNFSDSDLEKAIEEYSFGVFPTDTLRKLCEYALEDFLLYGFFLFLKKRNSKLERVPPQKLLEIELKNGEPIFSIKTLKGTKSCGLRDVIFAKNGPELMGTPFVQSALDQLRDISIYSKSALKAAEISSKNLGILTVPAPTSPSGSVGKKSLELGKNPGYYESQAALLKRSFINFESHSIGFVPHDTKAIELRAQNKASEFPSFFQAQMEILCSSLGISFQTLFKSYRNTNYSSMLHAVDQEIQTWKFLEKEIVEGFVTPTVEFYTSFLNGGFIDTGFEVVRKQFEPVDKKKYTQTQIMRLRTGQTTFSAIASKEGKGLLELLNELRLEKNQFKKAGLERLYEAFLGFNKKGDYL